MRVCDRWAITARPGKLAVQRLVVRRDARTGGCDGLLGRRRQAAGFLDWERRTDGLSPCQSPNGPLNRTDTPPAR
jgi:hypothetical protein